MRISCRTPTTRTRVAPFTEDLQDTLGRNRIAQDVEGVDLTGVSGTPTFRIDGRRHHGACDIDILSRARASAGRRAGSPDREIS